MKIIFTKGDFLKYFRKVKHAQIDGPLNDSFWRNNLSKARKIASGEGGPQATIVFTSLDDPQVDVNATLQRNAGLWIVDDQEKPVNLPGIECPVEVLLSPTPPKKTRRFIDKFSDPDYPLLKSAFNEDYWEPGDTINRDYVHLVLDDGFWLYLYNGNETSFRELLDDILGEYFRAREEAPEYLELIID